MKCVYRGTSLADLYLARDWLERNDFPATVRGQDLVGLLGEIPVPDALPSLWVADEHASDAEEALRRFHGPRLVHPAWECTRCREENPASFGSCWSCGEDGPAVAAAGG